MFTLVLFDTQLGRMGAIGSPKGLKKIIMAQKLDRDMLETAAVDNVFTCDPGASYLGDLTQRIKLYLEGKNVDFNDKLDLDDATDFEKAVWLTTRTIPYGQTRSYAWVAGAMKNPKAARAIGQALARNPLPIVVPCHRVIASDGSLCGFAGGLEMKEFLLNLERSNIAHAKGIPNKLTVSYSV